MGLITGGAGFIGSNFAHHWIEKEKEPLVNLDKLTYAGNVGNLTSILHHPLHTFVQGDIADRSLVKELLHKHQPKYVIHFAAETHVDRSIHDPALFVQTNILGSHALLEEVFTYWKDLSASKKKLFRFLNISTDEVFGTLSPASQAASEDNPYRPNSPYSASKAGFDHLVRAYHETFGMPTLITYCTNNFGPYQFPEKLIPLVILNALQGKALPIYGDGNQIRNWMYVKEHCEALLEVIKKGKPGESYNIGNEKDISNLELVHLICSLLDELKPDSPFKPHSSLIQHVQDRPGHDRRYSLNSSKIKKELGWKASMAFNESLKKTVVWYLENALWLENVQKGEYRTWIANHYAGH